MHPESRVPLVGGMNHGSEIEVDERTSEIEIDVHTTDSPTSESTFTETYARRHFDGEEFGEGFDCFVSQTDDDTEQKELARWALTKETRTPARGKAAPNNG